MAVLAKSPLPLLESWAEMLNKSMNNSMNKSSPYSFVWLRRPEVGLTMARARIGGTGNRFNFGELTVTRCALRLASGQHGVAYVQGRSKRKAELVALADALLQNDEMRASVEQLLLQPIRQRLSAMRQTTHDKAQATRVEFFTVARDGGGG
jgi:alpha-D-ribose 1-methylphosphonate 5-triphosphate synthase subunit PhnG